MLKLKIQLVNTQQLKLDEKSNAVERIFQNDRNWNDES